MNIEDMAREVQKMLGSNDAGGEMSSLSNLPDLSALMQGGVGGGRGSILSSLHPILSERRRSKLDDAVRISQVFGMMKNFRGGNFNG